LIDSGKLKEETLDLYNVQESKKFIIALEWFWLAGKRWETCRRIYSVLFGKIVEW